MFSVQEGSVLLLRSFIVKQRFRMPEHRLWQPPGLPWYDVDINVNAHHPAGEVTLLDPAVVEDLRDTQLPLPVTNFVTRKQLRCVSLCLKITPFLCMLYVHSLPDLIFIYYYYY